MNDSRAVPLSIDEKTAETQDKALAVLQQLLKERGVRSRCHQVISLGLFANRQDATSWPDKPPVRSWLSRCPPELVVIDPAGRGDVTVTMGARAECYSVCPHNAPAPQAVSRKQPEKAVELILANGPKTAA